MALPHRAAERLLVLPLAGLMAATVTAPAAGSTTPPDDAAHAPDEPAAAVIDEPVTVTLITGDRVRLIPTGAGGQPEVIVDPAIDSEPTGFSVAQDERGIRVIPHDVADLVPDVLDPGLFDVTQLVAMGYDDANADGLPLIVQHTGGIRTLAASSPLEVNAGLPAIDGAAVHLDKEKSAEFGDDLAAIDQAESYNAAAALGGVTKVWLDRKVTSTELDGYLSQVSAPAAWESGLDGSGVTIAVLDTGVDADHPDLKGQVAGQADFTGAGSPADDNGHGTHVASIAAGTGAGAGGARQGIAPGADIVSGKVLDSEGRGQTSWVMAGMEWAVQQGADVVNLSLGGAPTETDDPLVLTLEALAEQHGTLFVAAAGNRGWLGFVPGTIETPGSAPSALTVGAVTDTDLRAFFSSQGPTLGTYRLKPDVVAPGVGILGALAGARDGDLYQPMSGTSQATPIVAGAAALLMQQHPDWTWNEVKTRIMTTADIPDLHLAWSHGSGRVDLGEATSQELFADVGSLDFGYLKYPDERPRTRTVTLTNSGDDPLEIVVDDVVKNDSGQPAADDVLVAEPAALTIPAGGSAATTVTFRPDLVEDGFWDGGLSFRSGGDTLLHLPFGVYDEPERYDLQIQLLDRNGRPYDPATGADHPNGDVTVPIFNGDTGAFYRLRPDESGYAKARVAPGSYSMFARIVTPAGGGEPETFTIAGTPELVVESDVSYVIDAREARRLDPPTVSGQPTRPEHLVGITYSRHTDDRRGYTEIGFFEPEEVTNGQIYVTPTSPAARGTFEATFRWRLIPTGEPMPTSPDAFELLLASPRFPDPLSPALSPQDVGAMAKVETTFHPFGRPGEYWHGVVHQAAETGIGFVYRTAVEAPGSSTVLATAEPNILWAQCINPPANDYAEMCDELRSYPPREQLETQFGAALRPQIWESRHSSSAMFVASGIGDGEHAVYLTPTAAQASNLTLYRNGELVDSVDDSAGFFPLPDGPARFRLEQSWLLTDEFSRSREATTVWEFDSAPPADPSQGFSTTPPLMAINYRAQVDDMGNVAPQRSLRLDLDVSRTSRPQSSAAVESMSVWWSVDDGATWRATPARKSGPESFHAVIPGHVLSSGDSLSLRVSAIDADGNSIDQSVIGIFPVARPATG